MVADASAFPLGLSTTTFGSGFIGGWQGRRSSRGVRFVDFEPRGFLKNTLERARSVSGDAHGIRELLSTKPRIW